MRHRCAALSFGTAGFEYENAQPQPGARSFFAAQADLRTGWTARARSPPTGDCGALIYGRCSMANQMSEYPHYIERPEEQTTCQFDL